jgi:nucleoside-diphosphate-sugar epimerase
VFLSSPSIYFRPRDQFDLSEAFVAPQRWPTIYAETKWLAETRVLAAPEICPVILRPRAVFGPRDTAIVPRIVAAARTGLLPLPDGGRAWTDITYVDNVVAAVANVLQSEREIGGKAFNITNGEPIQVRDLLGRLVTALNLRVRFISMPRRLALALAFISERCAALRGSQREPRLTSYGIGLLGYSQTLSIEAARRQLGYTPVVSIDEGLERYARWWKSQQ